jgi:phosphoribosylamine--glycine ligase
MPRLAGDWLELLAASARGELSGVAPRWRDDATVCVVMASAGYPQEPRTGVTISGLEKLAALEDVWAFHAGTSRNAEGAIVTAGGRVLGMTARASSLPAARRRAYDAVASVAWAGMQYRSDIAADALGGVE